MTSIPEKKLKITPEVLLIRNFCLKGPRKNVLLSLKGPRKNVLLSGRPSYLG